jgi:hypothetical protein
MRRLVPTGIVAAVVLAIAPAGVLAGGPDEQFRDVGTDVDPDFCGTGAAIDVAFNIRVNVWLLPGNPEDFRKITQSGKVTFTNPENGNVVVLSFAGQVTNTILEGDPFGAHTRVFTNKGLPEKIQTSQGRVLTRDAGLITEVLTFDENGDVIAYFATWSGPHPEAASEFALFCEVTTEALGI